jgi:hypothetical protein
LAFRWLGWLNLNTQDIVQQSQRRLVSALVVSKPDVAAMLGYCLKATEHSDCTKRKNCEFSEQHCKFEQIDAAPRSEYKFSLIAPSFEIKLSLGFEMSANAISVF